MWDWKCFSLSFHFQSGLFASANSIGPIPKYGFHILIKEEDRQTNRIDRQTDKQTRTEFNKKKGEAGNWVYIQWQKRKWNVPVEKQSLLAQLWKDHEKQAQAVGAAGDLVKSLGPWLPSCAALDEDGSYSFINNKAGYTAQNAPSMRTFHLRK